MFLLGAFGSAILHAALLAGLSYLPSFPLVKEPTPTVQVTLVPGLQTMSPAPQPPAKNVAPARPVLPEPTPPSPLTEPIQSTPSPPVQTSLKPAPSPLAPPPPLTQAPPAINDTRTDQAIKSRQMMKMAVPHKSTQTPQPSTTSPQMEQPTVKMPFNASSQHPMTPHTLPPPQSPTTHSALKAPTPVSTGASSSRPMIVSSSKPLYPRVARESGWEGTVIVRTLISIDGIPSQVEIRKSCGHEALDLAAQEAIKSWKFQPAKDGNIPVAKWVDIPIKFDLNS